MTTGPKWSRGALDLINNTYVVRNNLLYEYYPISVYPYNDSDPFIRLETSPGIMTAGVAIVDNTVYDVSLADILRRRINVKNKRLYATGDNSDAANKSNGKQSKESRKAKNDSNQQGLSELFGDEISEAADLAFEDQVDTLLQALHSQEGEEFEITSTTQSRRVDAGGAVPNLLENS